jgi:hypothetical protein
MARFVDAIITYRILRKLTTPFEETDAYRLGIIDQYGRPLKKDRDLNSVAERDAYTILDRMIFRLKRIINKVPVENKRISSFAAALSLVREHHDATTEPVFLENEFVKRIATTQELNEVTDYMSGRSMLTFKMHTEEGIANAVGGGFSGQATANPNPNLAGRDMGLGKKIMRRKKPNV